MESSLTPDVELRRGDPLILLTVGTQLPFDRLVRTVDDIAPSLGKRIYAQTGACVYEPRNMEWSRFVGPIEFEDLIERCDLIVSHAGVGTVLAAQRYGKPVILFPRRAALGEHRSDHQMSTVAALDGRSGVHVARTVEKLVELLHQDLAPPVATADNRSRERLQRAVADFIRDG